MQHVLSSLRGSFTDATASVPDEVHFWKAGAWRRRPVRRLMKWWECILQTDVSVLQEKKQPSTQTGWPRASEKTLLYECGLLCGPMCVWWRCSNWRWVWLTSSIRSVVEVWTAALPRYRDHRIQTTICQTSFFFFPLLLGLKNFSPANVALCFTKTSRSAAWGARFPWGKQACLLSCSQNSFFSAGALLKSLSWTL